MKEKLTLIESEPDNVIPFLPKKRKHEWGPSRVGHGETQCIHCLCTNREAAVIAPEYCLPKT